MLTALALVLLGGAWVLGERAWPVPRALASRRRAARGSPRSIGFLLGVPAFYGPSRSVEMSWQAALCSVLLGISFGATHMHRTSRLLSDDGLVGHFARRVLPGVLAIPVLSGTLCMAAAREGWFGFEFAAWLMTLSAVAGLAVVAGLAITELAGEERRLTELAIRDPLTGAYNRRHFLTEAQHAASRAQRYGEQAAVAVVDLDHFKEINDSLGPRRRRRGAGAVLSRPALAAALQRRARADRRRRVRGARPARGRARGAAGRRGDARGGRAASALELAAEGRANRLTASVGIAPLHVDDPRDVDTLIDLADQRMYLAKRAKALTE